MWREVLLMPRLLWQQVVCLKKQKLACHQSNYKTNRSIPIPPTTLSVRFHHSGLNETKRHFPFIIVPTESHIGIVGSMVPPQMKTTFWNPIYYLQSRKKRPKKSGGAGWGGAGQGWVKAGLFGHAEDSMPTNTNGPLTGPDFDRPYPQQ